MWWFAACATPEDSAPPVQEVCTTEEEAGATTSTDCTGDCDQGGTGGGVAIRLVTDVGVDPTAPEYTTFKDWTLTPAGGGVPTTGETDLDRWATATVGAGEWDFASAFVRGGHSCAASLRVTVEVGKETDGCALMHCPTE